MSKPQTYGVFGARGTGKTAWALQEIERINPPRLLVWDFKEDHTLAHLGTGQRTIPALARACDRPAFRVRYVPDHGKDIDAQFESFCQVAWIAGNALVFVDELAEVTQAGKAPPTWRRLVNVGRSYEGGKKWLSIMGVSQRMAEVDKSFVGNLDVLHVGRLGNDHDAKRAGPLIGVPWTELTQLPDLDFIEKRAGEREPIRGKVTFTQKKVAPPRKARGSP